jgi:hypothetical protein
VTDRCAVAMCLRVPEPGRTICAPCAKATRRATDYLRQAHLAPPEPISQWSFLCSVSADTPSEDFEACRMFIARDPVKRCEDLQAGCPFPLEISHAIMAPRIMCQGLIHFVGRRLSLRTLDALRASPERVVWHRSMTDAWWPLDAGAVAVAVDEVLAEQVRRPGLTADLAAAEQMAAADSPTDPAAADLLEYLQSGGLESVL